MSDILLVHSEMQPARLRQTYDELTARIGPAGTLIVPTFTYSFCEGQPWDIDRTPSETGLFSEYVRRLPGAVRSLQPIYSFAAIGPKAHELLDGVSHSSFGRGSVFERLVQLDAKVLFLGCLFQRCTLVHHAEQMANVPYRFLKYFTGRITAGGQTYTDTYDAFVRYLDRNIESDFSRLFAGKDSCLPAREIYAGALALLASDERGLLAR